MKKKCQTCSSFGTLNAYMLGEGIRAQEVKVLFRYGIDKQSGGRGTYESERNDTRRYDINR